MTDHNAVLLVTNCKIAQFVLSYTGTKPREKDWKNKNIGSNGSIVLRRRVRYYPHTSMDAVFVASFLFFVCSAGHEPFLLNMNPVYAASSPKGDSDFVYTRENVSVPVLFYLVPGRACGPQGFIG